MRIYTIQVLSRRVSTARSIYIARSGTVKATMEVCEHMANVAGTSDETLPTKQLSQPSPISGTLGPSWQSQG